MSARLLLGLLLLLLSGAVQADYKTDYQDGVEAAEKKNWAEVRRLMRAALAQEATPNKRMRTYGTNFIAYVPHYYLGLANAELGDCAAALSAFKTPASDSIVSSLPLATQQRAAVGKCEQQMLAANTAKPTVPDKPIDTKPTDATGTAANSIADTRPPVAPPVTPPVKPVTPPSPALPSARLATVNSALARIDTQINGLDRQLRAPPMAGTGDAKGKSRDLAALRQQRQQAASALAAAQNIADLTKIEAQARKLESDLTTLGERIDAATKVIVADQEKRALEQLRTRATAALTKLDQTVASAGAAGLAATATSAATAARAALQQALTAADAKLLDRALTAAGGATTQLENAIAAAPKPAPVELRTLVGWYLAADYEKAANWNGVDALPDARARAQALLVRAAARLHLYVRGGEQEGSLNAAVDTDLRNAKRLDKTLKPNAQAFSPKLVQRFASL